MLKTAFHVHSDWSYDGRWSLGKIAEVFAQRGYDAVMLCEHCRTFDEERWKAYLDACFAVKSGARLVPGIEYSDPSNVIHVPVWGLDRFAGAEPGLERLVMELRAKTKNRFAVMAHPSRRDAWKIIPSDLLDEVDAVETWNRKADGFAPSVHAARLVGDSRRAIAALDFHSDRQRFPFVLEIDVPTRSTIGAIIEGLQAGQHRSCFRGRDLQGVEHGLKGQALRRSEDARRFLSGVMRTLRGMRS